MRCGQLRLRQTNDVLRGELSVHQRQSWLTGLGLSHRLRFLLRKPARARGIEAVEEKSSEQGKRAGKSKEHPPAENERRSPREAGPKECRCGWMQVADVERCAAVVLRIEVVHLVLHLTHHRNEARVIGEGVQSIV